MSITTRRPGFTIPGVAAAAGRKAQQLGDAHRWTPDEAREQARRAVEARAKQRHERDDKGTPCLQL